MPVDLDQEGGEEHQCGTVCQDVRGRLIGRQCFVDLQRALPGFDGLLQHLGRCADLGQLPQGVRQPGTVGRCRDRFPLQDRDRLDGRVGRLVEATREAEPAAELQEQEDVLLRLGAQCHKARQTPFECRGSGSGELGVPPGQQEVDPSEDLRTRLRQRGEPGHDRTARRERESGPRAEQGVEVPLGDMRPPHCRLDQHAEPFLHTGARRSVASV